MMPYFSDTSTTIENGATGYSEASATFRPLAGLDDIQR